MTDKEQQQRIEEIGKVMCEEFRSEHCGNDCECANEFIAKKLVEQGYRKIPKGVVVLTQEEYNALMLEQQRLKEIVDRIPCGYELKDKTRKETAKEILDKIDYESNGQTKQITDLLRKKFGVEVK